MNSTIGFLTLSLFQNTGNLQLYQFDLLYPQSPYKNTVTNYCLVILSCVVFASSQISGTILLKVHSPAILVLIGFIFHIIVSTFFPTPIIHNFFNVSVSIIGILATIAGLWYNALTVSNEDRGILLDDLKNSHIVKKKVGLESASNLKYWIISVVCSACILFFLVWKNTLTCESKVRYENINWAICGDKEFRFQNIFEESDHSNDVYPYQNQKKIVPIVEGDVKNHIDDPENDLNGDIDVSNQEIPVDHDDNNKDKIGDQNNADIEQNHEKQEAAFNDSTIEDPDSDGLPIIKVDTNQNGEENVDHLDEKDLRGKEGLIKEDDSEDGVVNEIPIGIHAELDTYNNMEDAIDSDLEVDENEDLIDTDNGKIIDSVNQHSHDKLSERERQFFLKQERRIIRKKELLRQMREPVLPNRNANLPVLIPFNQLRSIPSIVEFHRVDLKNVGDISSSPFRYFPELSSNFKKYTIDIGNNYFAESIGVANNTLPIIIGGGGLIGCMRTWDANTRRLIKFSRYVIGWGIGFNVHRDIRYHTVPIGHLKQMRLLGLRDVMVPYRWVPCSSGMYSRFPELKRRPTVRAIGFFVHRSYSFNVNNGTFVGGDGRIYKRPVKFIFGDWKNDRNVNAMKNNGHSMDDVVDFLASCDVIVTSSYHGMYWATLLGKKVIIHADFSIKFMYFAWPARKYSGNLQKDIQEAVVYPNALIQARSANLEFWADVKSALVKSLSRIRRY
ncbi:hypothetical protein HK096_008447 [Nowakowskiella sp. JEL0078]|nr:hypothetical protein HK096_008447 [Nowakowskiella sp. JEL0078]